MNAIVSLSSAKSRRLVENDLAIAYNPPANDGANCARGGIFGPEESLRVSFVGLSDDEARRALESFPGALRCVLDSH